MSDDVNFNFETHIEHGTPQWYAERTPRSIGSSEVAKVFSGIVSGSARRELCDKFKGAPKPAFSSYALEIMEQGKKMEPYLLQEFAAQFNVFLLRANLFKLPYLTGDNPGTAVQEVSSPDGIVMTTCYPHRLALVEIKWRSTSEDDCGWGPARDRIGFPQWCQLQHQMFVTGIHAGFLYSGSPSGARRAWRVAYCHEFRRYFTDALAACVEGQRHDTQKQAEVRLGCMVALTTQLSYVSLPKDQGIEEVKGGAASDTESDSTEAGTDSSETPDPDR